MKGIHFDISDRNKWFITKDKEIFSFIYAESVDGKIKIACKKIIDQLNSFFEVPINSKDLDIYYIENINYSTRNSIIDHDFIQCKMFSVPHSNGFVFVPISNH